MNQIGSVLMGKGGEVRMMTIQEVISCLEGVLCGAELLETDVDDIVYWLQKQEPRVITQEELKQFEGSPCWFESHGTYMGKDGFWIIPAMFRTFFAGTIMSYISVLKGVGDCGELGLPAYNKAWRCWTGKPTDEQRKAVKWNV